VTKEFKREVIEEEVEEDDEEEEEEIVSTYIQTDLEKMKNANHEEMTIPEESIDAYKATSSQWNGTSYGMIDILPIGTIIVESDEYPFTCVLYKGELQYIRINTDSSLWSTFDGVIPENINLTIEGQTQSFAITKVIGKFTSSSVGFKPFVFSSFVTEINFTNTTGIYENITINATNPPKFTGTLPLRTGLFIYVPAESVTAYKTAEGWSDYAEYIVPIQ